MIVVSDTTPMIALMKAGHIDWLKQLYHEISIPDAVFNELTTNETFQDEAEQIKQCDFIKVYDVNNHEAVEILRSATGLDAGESEAIVLYTETQANFLLLDEHKARGVAKQMEISFIGTLGVLMLAYDKKIASAEAISL